jgi:hypothetical protein
LDCGFFAQQLKRFLELYIFLRRLRLRPCLRLVLALIIRLRLLLPYGVVVIARQIIRVNRIRQLRPLDFNRRSDARACSVVAEEGLALAGSPFDYGQEQPVAVSERKELLFSARAEALFAHHIAAFGFSEGRGYDFSSTRGAPVNQHRHGAIEDCLSGICRRLLQDFAFAPDLLRQSAIFDEEIGYRYAFLK